MKKPILIIAVAALTLTMQQATAQLKLNVNVNLGSQPEWGPAGHDYVEYYYLPDIKTYYYVPGGQFVYLNNKQWIFSNDLPARYNSYNLYTGYKVVINESKPYLRDSVYQSRFARYKGWTGRQRLNAGNAKYKLFNGRGNALDRN
jgi:hypothetical protein